jgi:hypothetical protein
MLQLAITWTILGRNSRVPSHTILCPINGLTVPYIFQRSNTFHIVTWHFCLTSLLFNSWESILPYIPPLRLVSSLSVSTHLILYSTKDVGKNLTCNSNFKRFLCSTLNTTSNSIIFLGLKSYSLPIFTKSKFTDLQMCKIYKMWSEQNFVCSAFLQRAHNRFCRTELSELFENCGSKQQKMEGIY